MVERVEALRIPASIDDVWKVLAEFDAIARWAPDVDHSCRATEQSTGVGTVRRIQNGRLAVLERVVAWEPPHLLGYVIDGALPVDGSVTNTWRLDSVGTSTTVSLTSRVETGSRPAHAILARAVGRVLAKMSRRMLNGLAEDVRGMRGDMRDEHMRDMREVGA